MITENKIIYILNFLNDFVFNESDKCPYEDYPNMSNTRIITIDEPYFYRIRLVEYNIMSESNRKIRSISLNSTYKNMTIVLIKTLDKIVVKIKIKSEEDILEFTELEYYHDDLSFILEHGKKTPDADYIDEFYYCIKGI